jgi:hypothetical protein
MRMPTHLPEGEGWMGGEAIDTRTRSIRRGGHGTLVKVLRVIGGDPLLARVAASASREAVVTAGVGQGRMSVDAGYAGGAKGALTSGILLKTAR